MDWAVTYMCARLGGGGAHGGTGADKGTGLVVREGKEERKGLAGAGSRKCPK